MIEEAQSTVDVEVMKSSTNHYASLLRRNSVSRVGNTIRVPHYSISFSFVELAHLAIRVIGHWWAVGAFR